AQDPVQLVQLLRAFDKRHGGFSRAASPIPVKRGDGCRSVAIRRRFRVVAGRVRVPNNHEAARDRPSDAILRSQGRSENNEWCPRWESNPHWRRFELRASADWATGTSAELAYLLLLRTATRYPRVARGIGATARHGWVRVACRPA